jgi:hypothetical protein
VGTDPVTDTIHQELCAAIAELAKSVDLAVKRMAIRAKFAAAIADAKKTERVAGELLAAALQELGPTEKPVPAKQATTPQIPERDNIVVIDKLDAACRWLSEVTAGATPQKLERKKNESAFALSLLKLHDRTGGFLKSNFIEKTSQNEVVLADN